MSDKDDLEQLREVMKVLGDSLPNLLKGLADVASDQKRVAAFATSTAEFYKQLKEAGVPDEKAVELTKAFMERAGPSSPLGAIFGNIGPDLKDLGPLFEKTSRGPRTFTVRVGDVDKGETSSSTKSP